MRAGDSREQSGGRGLADKQPQASQGAKALPLTGGGGKEKGGPSVAVHFGDEQSSDLILFLACRVDIKDGEEDSQRTEIYRHQSRQRRQRSQTQGSVRPYKGCTFRRWLSLVLPCHGLLRVPYHHSRPPQLCLHTIHGDSLDQLWHCLYMAGVAGPGPAAAESEGARKKTVGIACKTV